MCYLTLSADASPKIRSKPAKFRVTKTLYKFDYSRLEHESQAYIQEFAICDFIKKRQNIVMIGNPVAGKTHLSIGLRMKTSCNGYNANFYTAINPANELAEAAQFHRMSKLEKALVKMDLLIIDELSYLTFNRHQSAMLFQVISERSEMTGFFDFFIDVRRRVSGKFPDYIDLKYIFRRISATVWVRTQVRILFCAKWLLCSQRFIKGFPLDPETQCRCIISQVSLARQLFQRSYVCIKIFSSWRPETFILHLRYSVCESIR